MANQIEQFIPVVQSDGLNTNKAVVLGSTLSVTGALTQTGAATFNGGITLGAGGGFTPSGTAVILVGTSSTATASGGSATINAQRGVLTTEALTTAAGSATVVTLKNTSISTTSQILASVRSGSSNTTGYPTIGAITPFGGSATISVMNAYNLGSLNGSVVISFIVLS